MIKGAPTKEARTRLSSEGRRNTQVTIPLTDERLADWTPARISDRKLQQLATRLEKLRTLGDSFAGLALSHEANQRLAKMSS